MASSSNSRPFLGPVSIAFTFLITSQITSASWGYHLHCLPSSPLMLHDVWRSGYSQNLWSDLLFECNNAISNADHSPCTVCGHKFAFRSRYTVFWKVIGQFCKDAAVVDLWLFQQEDKRDRPNDRRLPCIQSQASKHMQSVELANLNGETLVRSVVSSNWIPKQGASRRLAKSIIFNDPVISERRSATSRYFQVATKWL